VVERGEKVVQETRLWDPDKNKTFTMRSKEEAQDYRYFPDPDLLPLTVSDEMIAKLKAELPELPIARKNRFVSEQSLPEHDAEVLTGEKDLADFYEETAKVSKNYKSTANWIMTELIRELNDNKLEITASPIKPAPLGQLIALIDKGIISGKIAKTVFSEMWKTGKEPEAIIKEKGLVQVSDPAAIEKIVDEVLAANAQQVTGYKSGKANLFGFFVGAVMKASKGQANPELVNQILQKKLNG
jgi:aspartyl-tRNA(Asn)/glutamyl-tRNA(Gln) amidotransferase subunit B